MSLLWYNPMNAMIKQFFLNIHDLNLACREYFLKSDTDLTGIALGIAAILLPLFVCVTLLFFRG